MNDVTVPAGQVIPSPPAGTSWMFVSQGSLRNLVLRALPRPAGQADPNPPRGCAWRVLRIDGQRIYIAQPRAFLHHPVARYWCDDV